MEQLLVLSIQPVNAFAHAVVNLFEMRMILQKLTLLTNHVFIVSHGRSCLEIGRAHV